MKVKLENFKALTEGECSLTLSEVLAARRLQYQNVRPEEILDLLEEASVTYDLLAPTLSPQLRNTSRQEIEFFLSIYQDSLKNSLGVQRPQKILKNGVCRNFRVNSSSF